MGAKSAIEWTDATWNPVTGCTKVSPGCKHCYAERLAARLQAMGNPHYRHGFAVTLHPDQLTLPLRWRQPKRIFVNSMSDLFHEAIPDAFIAQTFAIMAQAHWHTFQILTKRAERLAALAPHLPWAPNIWQGVSVENAQYTWRVASLQQVPAAIRFLSIEPLLGAILALPLEGIHWVIVGGESGPQHRPLAPAWVQAIRDQCLVAGVPFFFKQWGGHTPKSGGRALDGRVWNEMPVSGDARPRTSRDPAPRAPPQRFARVTPPSITGSGDAMHVQSTVSKKTPWHDAFFDQPRLTSKLKHCILEAYVKVFAYHLGSARPTVYYVDGFAGPGGYRRPTGEFEPGSPVLIAQFAEHLRATTASFTVKCLNVEADRERHQQLVDATAAFTGAIIEQNYCASFTGVLGDILRRVGNAPAFFFLDPFGTKGLPFRALLPLFRRGARTEVLITLHTDGIAKKAGWFASLDDADPQKRRTALALTEHLAKALDLSREALYAWWVECGGGGDGWTTLFEQRVLRHYATLLRAPRTTFRFTKAFPVYYYGPDAPPGEEAPVCFYLIFGTQHQKGLYEMNDCMVKALDGFYEQEYRHTFFPLFRDASEKPKELARLQHEIVTQFRNSDWTIDQIKQHLMQASTLLVSGKAYREAVMRLKKDGRLEQLDRGPVNNERTRFRVRSSPPAAAGMTREGRGIPLSLDLTWT
jgi:three-Cys-motif partner protein